MRRESIAITAAVRPSLSGMQYLVQLNLRSITCISSMPHPGCELIRALGFHLVDLLEPNEELDEDESDDELDVSSMCPRISRGGRLLTLESDACDAAKARLRWYDFQSIPDSLLNDCSDWALVCWRWMARWFSRSRPKSDMADLGDLRTSEGGRSPT